MFQVELLEVRQAVDWVWHLCELVKTNAEPRQLAALGKTCWQLCQVVSLCAKICQLQGQTSNGSSTNRETEKL